MAERLITEVADLAAKHGVFAHHSTDSRRDLGKGFFDWFLIGPSGFLFAECKSNGQDLTSEQKRFRWLLIANGLPSSVWYPTDLASGRIDREIAALA